jgi:purine-binding chemotaxis protein CheW
MDDLLLIVRVAGRRIAFPAAQVEGVVEIEDVRPVPGAAAHVAGLAALRSRVLTVIDCLAALGFGRRAPAGLLEAVVVPSGGHVYALLVDEVEDVVAASAPPADLAAPLGAGWDQAALGMVECERGLLLLADPHALIAGAGAQTAQAA